MSPKKEATLQQLEAEARAAKRGLWRDPHAVAPGAFRTERRCARSVHGRPQPLPASLFEIDAQSQT